MNISKLSIQAEVDGKACFILVPDRTEEMILTFISGLSKNKKLQVLELPDKFKIQSLAEIVEIAGQSE